MLTKTLFTINPFSVVVCLTLSRNENDNITNVGRFRRSENDERRRTTCVTSFAKTLAIVIAVVTVVLLGFRQAMANTPKPVQVVKNHTSDGPAYGTGELLAANYSTANESEPIQTAFSDRPSKATRPEDATERRESKNRSAGVQLEMQATSRSMNSAVHDRFAVGPSIIWRNTPPYVLHGKHAKRTDPTKSRPDVEDDESGEESTTTDTSAYPLSRLE